MTQNNQYTVMDAQAESKLIAEFMDWTSYKSEDAGILGGSITYWKNPKTGKVGYFHPDKYHQSWDWLIPVVLKIRDMKIDNFPVKKPLMQAVARLEFEEIYKETIRFIQWYNKNIKTHLTN